VEVPNDGASGEHFRALFPFSFFISKHMETMRQLTESADESALQQQFSMLGLGHGLDGDLSNWNGRGDKLLRRYMHDFVCMQCLEVSGMDRQGQAEFAWNALSKPLPVRSTDRASEATTAAEDEAAAGIFEITSLAAIHYRFWRVERTLQLYFALMDAFPTCHATVIQVVEESARMDSRCSAKVLQCVLDAIDPASQAWADASDYNESVLPRESRPSAR
jgi:hypothetical protein